MYNNERNSTNLSEGHKLPESEYTFEVKIENDVRQVYRQIQKALTTYKDEKRGKNRMLKFRFSKKATHFETISHLI